MEHCHLCGEEAVRRTVLPEHLEDLGGVKVRIKDTVMHEVCDACGDETTEIPDLAGLVKAVALARLLMPVRLSGKEIRFLRSALQMTGRAFAETLEVKPETVSRWENGENGAGAYVEKLLRHNLAAILYKDVPAFDYDPSVIARMKIVEFLPGIELPPFEMRRVLVKAPGNTGEDAWDVLAKAA